MRKSFAGSRKRWELRKRPYFYARKPLAVPIKRLAQGRLTESLGLVLEDSDVIKITHLLSSAVCLCATVRAGGQIDASWMHDDERLSRMVSITSLVEHVGDISAELQKQTGIRFEIDDSSGGSTGPILVSVRDLRAWGLMDAIWSLFSYKHAPWKLTRQERGHDAVYTLTAPRKAVEYASVIERDMYDSFFRHAETMIRASKLPPEGRHEMLDEIAQSLLEDNPEAFRPFLDDESLWSGLRIFSEVVDPGAFSAVLRGGGR